MQASNLQETEGRGLGTRLRGVITKLDKKVFADAIPGLLIGAGGTITNMQAGRLPPETLWFVVPSLLGGALSAGALWYAVSAKLQRLVGYAGIGITLGLLLFAHDPQADIRPTRARSPNGPVIISAPAAGFANEDDIGQPKGEDLDEQDRAAEPPTRAPIDEQDRCARFDFGNDRDIWAMPTSGSPGSRSRPLRLYASSETRLALQIVAERATPYDFVELNAHVVTPPFMTRRIAFGAGTLQFEDGTVSVSDLRVSDENELTGVGTEAIPIPFGVIELSGGFSERQDGALLCRFQVYVQLVSRPWESGPAAVGALTLLGGMLALLRRVANAFREPPKTHPSPGPNKQQKPRGRKGTSERSTATSAANADANDEHADDRRLGVDVFVNGKKMQNALLRDCPTRISVSIAKPGAATVQLSDAANINFGDADVLELPVKFVDTSPHKDPADRVEMNATMELERDSSHKGVVKFDVIPQGTLFTAMITVFATDGSTVIQAATLRALVVPGVDDVPETSTIWLTVVPVSNPAVDHTNEGSTSSVIHDGANAMGSGNFPLAADVANAIAIISTITASLKTGAENNLVTNDPDHIRRTLVEAARDGYGMYKDLQLQNFDASDRIQVVAVSPQAVLPLELVYEAKGAPHATDTALCPTWMKDGACDTCRELSRRDQQKLVCPSLFWGVAKVVEHHRAVTAAGTAFELRPLRDSSSDPLHAPSTALVAMSARVMETMQYPLPPGAPALSEEQAKAQVLDSIRHNDVSAEYVPDWDAWSDKVEHGRYDVLVVMPHNGADENSTSTSSALEIGGDYERFIEEYHVLGPDKAVKPLVLLIGCNTGAQAEALASFASKFRSYSPIVIATVGEILAQQAPQVLETILSALREQGSLPDGKPGTVGDALRAARCSLLQDGILAGLQLVVHGDGFWPLTD